MIANMSFSPWLFTAQYLFLHKTRIIPRNKKNCEEAKARTRSEGGVVMKKRNIRVQLLTWLGAALGLSLAARAYYKQRTLLSLQGRVVLITGGSRGLGLRLAHAYAQQGARLLICARQAEPLELARQELAASGAEVLALPCDVQDPQQVEQMVAQGIAHFGRIDVLVNNAGIMLVGPYQTMTLSDYQTCMNTMFWGLFYTSMAVLSQMQVQQNGSIVNITSIGGKVSVPHLLPYSCAKFAALGFSEGLHAELAREGINVLSVVPGLMRTGSHVNAFMKGQHQQEYIWFGLSATLPLTSTSAAHAARQIVRATRRRATELIITPQARLISRLHGLYPTLTIHLLGIVNRILPQARNGQEEQQAVTGRASRSRLGAWLTKIGEAAAHTSHQYTRHEHSIT
jgi:NAD(P)-dependent dehydrogenase (short-subunit alcohol dehydrogenase family)